MSIIHGLLEKISYHNEENDFVVAKLREKDKRELTTIVGHLSGIHPGESLKLTGNWVHNKKFGEQFQVETFEVTIPATLLGIQKYLASGLIKGIGPIMSERIVEKFGLDTLEVIERKPERLSEVEGIGPKRISMIKKTWEEQKEIKEIMIFLQGHGVSASYSAKIYKQYGNQSIEIVKENPYRLAHDIYGTGFITADKIAQHLGIDQNSLIRAKAGLIYVLNQLTEEGHVYYPENQLIHKAREILHVDEEIIFQAVRVLSKEKELFLEDLEPEGSLRAVFLAPFYTAEKGVAQRLTNLKESPSNIRPIHPEKAIEWVQQKLGIELAQKQEEAVLLAATSKVLIITGGPGTGKTTIITAILRIFQQLKLRVLLAAPTGRAAKRMNEATGWGAKTIHRLLEYSPHKGGFKKDQDDPLEADVVIIDETSMVDTLLMHHLLKAIPSHAHLILVGDVDQLPSVGPGNILKDIIKSGRFTVVTLTEIFRQAQESMIVVNAHKVNQGQFPVLKGVDKPEETDFRFIQEEDPEKILQNILDLCSERIPGQYRFHPLQEIQVLAPMHKGTIGVANLNIELQKRLNPGPSGITRGTWSFRIGDKVMQIVNNYDKDVFNGDIGWISKIDPEEREVVIDFDGRPVPYDYSDLDEVVLAYAVSVHKAQGSEYPVVILPVVTQHYMLLQRNLIYTGITRAKKRVILIGTKKALGIAIRNNKPQRRYTLLSERLAAS
ncbi:MAG: helicase, RecD/TraA family [Deltaproteobacteria bacterium]|jgi:exodeoxyribonuclease V alpha subunit|nr:helicase, RecD/TraA family [Deltaproteobacteria bacterium]